MTLFKQNTLLVFQFKNFIDNRFIDNEIIVTFDSLKIIEFVIFNQTKFVEFDFSFTASKSTDKNRFISIKLVYIINWIIDRIKFRKNLRIFKNIIKSFLSFDNISRFFARNNFFNIVNFAKSKSKKLKTTRRHNHIFDITTEKNIYKQLFDSKLSIFTNNMFDQFFDEITQRLINVIVDKVIEFYIRRYSFQQNFSKSFNSQKVQNIVDAIVENDTFQ